VKLPFAYTSAGADFDEPARIYRYALWREWEAAPRRALWIMLNPSTADEAVLGPTLRRVEGFTRAWGYGGFIVCNLFALRSTDPAGLYTHQAPVGETDGPFEVNDDEIRAQANRAKLIVVGWGAQEIARPRHEAVVEVLRGHKLMCLGQNADGSPKHPLYLAAATQLREFKAAA
jgi:hypothetical protein